MQIFKFSKDWSVVCQSQSTRSGFRHYLATVLYRNWNRGTVKCTYINRTWETYEFQAVLFKALEYIKDEITKNLYTRIFNKINKGHSFD